MNIAPNQQRRRQIKKLREFFARCSDGEEILWVRIEEETKIEMDVRGKDLARVALKREKRPYIASRGDGMILSAPENTMEILGYRFRAIDRRVRAASKTRDQLSTRHLDALPQDTQVKLTALAAFFGQVRSIARQADQLVFQRLKMHAERAAKAEKKPPGL